tara:strand:- start:3790 stop:4392 length:603 start_codon:yes stop_codon:yes gene_type:complete
MRKVFYSFHYERDSWRAANVRNFNKIANEDEYGVIDSVEWEKIKQKGDPAIEKWIQEQLQSTSVTVVLIGTETASRPWVQYEIRESWKRGNALLGVYINSVKTQDKETDPKGSNPFNAIKFTDGTALSTVCPTYDWDSDNGRENMGAWVEDAYQARQKVSADKKIDEDDKGSNGGSGNVPRPPAPGPQTPPVPPRRREVG